MKKLDLTFNLNQNFLSKIDENQINALEIFKWLVIATTFILSAFLLKEIFTVAYFIFFLILLVIKKPHINLFFLIIWIFTFDFFKGQGYILYENAKTVEKLAFILLFGFILIDKKLHSNQLTDTSSFIKTLLSWNALLAISLLAGILFVNFNYPTTKTIISNLRYFFLFLIIYQLKFNSKECKGLLNLIIALSIIQVPIAIAQFNKIIPPSQTYFTYGGFTYNWEAGLDDVASGTFGAAASAQLSWFLSLISLFLFSYGILIKSNAVKLLSIFPLLQYAVVDSKGALAVTAFMFGLYFYNLYKYRILLKIQATKIIFPVLLLATFAYGFNSLWKNYYEKSEFTTIENVNQLYVSSYQTIFENVLSWGKIAGFYYVADLQSQENSLKILTGFGISEFSFAGKNRLWKVRKQLKISMQKHNGVNESSGFIRIFAETGLFGLLIVITIYYSLYRFYKKFKFNTVFGKNMQLICWPFLIGSALFGFTAGTLSIISLSLVTFWIFTALALKFENIYLGRCILASQAKESDYV